MSDARARAEDHYYAGLDLFADGHYQDAVGEYRAAVAEDPQFTDALHALRKALQELKDFDGAIEVSQQIAAIDSDDVLAHTSLSILYQNKGMIAEAEAESNKARILGWKHQLRDQKSGVKPPESL
jgi:tetratricopeptide (TPR) repeat protein